MLEKFQAPFLAVTKLSLRTLLAIRLGLEGSGKAAGTLRAPFFGDHGEKHHLHHLQDLLLSPSRACSEHLNEALFICGHGERHGLLLGCSSIFKPAFERAPGRTQINASAVKCKPAIKNDREEEKKVTIGWVASCQGEEGCFHAARGKYMCIRL